MLRRVFSTLPNDYHTASNLKNGPKHYSTTAVLRCPTLTNNNEGNHQPVADFYAGKSVFITGGTGFLGKILIERLLYNCKEIDKVYVLVREKRGVRAHDRLNDIVNNDLFSKLKAERPRDLNKIVPIMGDISSLKLGIKPEDEMTLIEKVSVVFHSAADVRFNRSLRDILKLNVEGTRELLNLSRQIRNIESFVYISTAFSNADMRTTIDEIVYPPPYRLNEVYEFIKNDEVDMKKILRGKPNTYAFSKSLAETMVTKNHGNIPTVIIRPSIVCSAKNEPIPGWLDNWYGATGLAYYASKGINRVIWGKKTVLMNIIPADYTTNLTIVAAARCSKTDTDVKVYNSCTSADKPLTWSSLADKFAEEYPKLDQDTVKKPKLYFISSPWLVSILTLVLHKAPANVADLWLRCRGKEPRYVKELSRALAGRDALRYFTSNSFIWNVSNARNLYYSLSPSDREHFPFDPSEINWNEYIKDYCAGVYKYLVAKKNNR
ncbi:unnamed protein product, partial [Iphiclides podalirius]